MQHTETQSAGGGGPVRTLYPVEPVQTAAEMEGAYLWSFGRLFVRGRDGRWHVVESF